jgi:hypothetical protein
MEQKHSGSGDNVKGNKIERQINMGNNSTYIENQRADITEKAVTEPTKKTEEAANTNSKLPETPSGFLGLLINIIPKPYNWLIAILLLGFSCFLAYRYLVQKKEEVKKEETAKPVTPVSTDGKVYVSGKIYINNEAPKLNEIKRMSLRDIDANSARIDGTGKFTFENIKIPGNKKLLIDVIFSDGKRVATEEMIVGKLDPETNTIYLPELNAGKPKPATKHSPASGWNINVVHNGNGDVIINPK